MKTYLMRVFRILIFLVAFAYLSVHFSYIYREPLSHTREHLMGFYSEEDNTVDVVVIGTSCTFSAVAPMQLWEDHGIAAYDFCTNVMLENTMRYAIREVVKTQSPRLFIIDVAPFINGHCITEGREEEATDVQMLRYNTDGFKVSKNRFDLINEIVRDPKKRLNYYYDLAYYHSNPEPDINNWNYDRPSAYKGYSNLQIEAVYTEKIKEESRQIEENPIPKEELAILDKFLEETEKRGLNVLFINGPYWTVDNGQEVSGKVKYIKDYITQKGFSYLDLHEYLDEIGMDGTKDYSMDYNHYSITGAVKISRFLGDYLVSNYDMADRRYDARYDKWRLEYKEWTDTILPENIKWSDRLRKEYEESHQ